MTKMQFFPTPHNVWGCTGNENYTKTVLKLYFHYGPVDELNPNGVSVPPIPDMIPFCTDRPLTSPHVLLLLTSLLCLPPLQSCKRKASIDGVLKSCIIYNLS